MAYYYSNQSHKFLILHKELDPDDGEITRTRKVRRSFVAEKYDELVTALYKGDNEVSTKTEVTYEDGKKGYLEATLALVDAQTYMLKEKSVKLELTNEAIDYLVENGYDSKMGARPMQRLIDDKIKQPLSKELLFGKLKQGGEVKVTANDKGLVLDIPDNVKLLEKQA